MAKAKSQLIANPSPPLTPKGTATGAESGPSSSTGGPHTTTGIRPDLDKADNTSSHNISISSITEDEDGNPVSGHGDDGDGSSAFDSSSDSDSDLCDNEQIKKAIERIPNSLQPGSQMVRLPAAGPETSVVTATALQERPNIGSIAVQNSSDITFGNKTYIKGQVVIKNIYHDRKATNGVGGGVVNEGYREADGEAGLPSQTKKDLSSQPAELPLSWRSSLKSIIRDKPLLSAIVLVALMFIVVTIATVVYVTTSAGKPRLRPHYGDGDDDRAYVPPDTGIEDDFLPDAKPLRIVTRNEWLAQPPREKLDDLKLPVHKVIIAHTATEECSTQSQCVAMTSRIQGFHMAPDSKNFSDIGYNFLVGADGNAYEGRGWDKQGAHTKGFNKGSICIAFIGTFTDVEAPLTQLSAARQLMALGVELGKVHEHYRLYGHRQLAPFESPGRKLYEVIKTWPHWSSELGPSHWEDAVQVAVNSSKNG
ncbi:peptidoglycan recognition protein-lc [Culex quinquefasciatus]|uniref:Peptidoglycan recognition protein-lc n=1 Tax=Culex quinquefasciatus TaxID=7176 RepID=B0WH93_CULQU|nr:peptidoglycan recognition protein-lc [Culex quinquefasciatus]|eukprot:XP_001848058.1 peptidoglycan recognition protein-lc [Culex quinquefasciatus]